MYNAHPNDEKSDEFKRIYSNYYILNTQNVSYQFADKRNVFDWFIFEWTEIGTKEARNNVHFWLWSLSHFGRIMQYWRFVAFAMIFFFVWVNHFAWAICCDFSEKTQILPIMMQFCMLLAWWHWTVWMHCFLIMYFYFRFTMQWKFGLLFAVLSTERLFTFRLKYCVNK